MEPDIAQDGAREKAAQENARNELILLRQELQELKRCQLQYFTLTVTGTAAILGFAGSLSGREFLGPSLLAPLAIIVPCWWIFFDKATTITRIVGYVRILEESLAKGRDPNLIYPGYEEALTLYREYEDRIHRKEEPQPPTDVSVGRRERIREWLQLLILRTRHRYWMVNFYTFAGLAVLCCSSGWWWFPTGSRTFTLFKLWSMGLCALVLIVSVIYSVVTVHQLTFGKRSYGSSAKFWRWTLNRKRLETVAMANAHSSDAMLTSESQRLTQPLHRTDDFVTRR
jgi:hypothetical protein